MTENVTTTRDNLVARLRRAGELEIPLEGQAETDQSPRWRFGTVGSSAWESWRSRKALPGSSKRT